MYKTKLEKLIMVRKNGIHFVNSNRAAST